MIHKDKEYCLGMQTKKEAFPLSLSISQFVFKEGDVISTQKKTSEHLTSAIQMWYLCSVRFMNHKHF